MSNHTPSVRAIAQYGEIMQKFIDRGGFPLSLVQGVITFSFRTEDDEQIWRLALNELEQDLTHFYVDCKRRDNHDVKDLLVDLAISYRTAAHMIRLSLHQDGTVQPLSKLLRAVDMSGIPFIHGMDGLRAGLTAYCLRRGWLDTHSFVDASSFSSALEALAFCVEAGWSPRMASLLLAFNRMLDVLKLKRRP